MDNTTRMVLVLLSGMPMIAAVPLILNKVPKNSFYGLRTPKVMAGSYEQWYRLNHEAGVALFIAGMVPILAWLVVPYMVDDPRLVAEICFLVMGISVATACAIEIVKHWN